jgi:hypothetical protein
MTQIFDDLKLGLLSLFVFTAWVVVADGWGAGGNALRE